MPSLTDISLLREFIIKSSVVPGQILKIYCPFINPPKDKWIILLSVEPRIRYIFINTNKSFIINNRPDLEYTNVEIKKSDYLQSDFTNDTSYADCLYVKSNLTYDGLVQELQDITRIKEKINRSTQNEIIKAIDNENVSPIIIKEVKNSLS